MPNNPAAPLIGKPVYVAPLVDEKGNLSRQWLPWYNQVYLAGLSIQSALASLASLQASLASDEATLASLESSAAQVRTSIAQAEAAIASVTSSLPTLTATVQAQGLAAQTLAARVAALEASEPTFRTVTAADTFGPHDFSIGADATAGAFSVKLPLLPSWGELHNLVKVDNSANAVTLDGNGKTINGFATIALTFVGTSLTPQFDGSNWRII